MTLKIDEKFEKKSDLLFHKWQEFGETWPKHSKSPIHALSFAPLVQSIYCLV